MSSSPPTPTPTKYCRDCFYARNRHTDAFYWTCKSPQNSIGKISLVDAEPIPIFANAQECRKSPFHCGQIGNWFISHRDHEKLSAAATTSMRNTTPKTIQAGDL